MNVLDLLREMGIEPRLAQRGGKRGAEYWSRCPKAGCSQEDGFHVWPEQNGGTGSWWCRNCDRGGDNIQFCRDYMGMDFQEACDKCGRDPGPRPPRRPFEPRPRPPAWAPKPVNVPEGDLALWREHAGKFAEWAHRQLLKNPEALDYLDRRGVKRNVVERWGLGWNPGENGKPCIYRARKAWGLPEETREGGRPKPLWLPRGLVIPWRDPSGCLRKIRIRRHPPDMPPLAKNKYFVVPGSTVVHTAVYSNQPAAVVLETELDGLAAAEAAGDLVGVVATGTSGALPQPQEKRLDISISLANKPLPYVVCDETDKYPETASKKEAGPVGLAEARATVFRGRRKFIRASTPTVPTAFIWQALKKCRAVFVYWVRCPLCGKWQRMELSRIRVPKDVRDPEEIKDRDLAWYECVGCGGHWDDHLRDRAVAAGQWRHREKGVEMFAYLEAFKPKTIGFHLPSWNSPFVGLSEVMAAWFKGQLDKTALKDFFNRFAAEPWVIREKERKEDAILALCEPRPMGRVPGDDLVSCLTFGADTQDNGFWFKIVANGWGLERDAWVVRCGFVPNFAALARVLWSDPYEDAGGKRYVVRFGLIDAMGHRTGEVYDFCRAHPGRIMPAKGEKIMNQPLAYTRIEYYPGTKKPIPGALQLVRVNTKYFKDQLAAALTVKAGDPGSIRMPEDLPRDYAVHYTAEFINEKGDWDCRPNVPNHLWDCGVLSSCAAEILQVRFWEKPSEEKLAPKPKNIPGPPPRVEYERPSWLEGR